MAHAMAELDAAVGAILATRAAAGPSQPATMLDLMLAADMSPVEVRDEIVTFLVAGHETVASALTWALLLLAGRPDVADDVAAEAREVLGAGPGPEDCDPAAAPPVGMEQLAGLVLSRAAVDEAMRLYPPAWLITRRTSVDLTLRGSHVPAGSLVIISPWIVHRHPDAWQDPQAFAPQRFLDTAVRSGAARNAYLPFGQGPRMCIGRDFAYAEAVLALSLVCRGFHLAPTGPPPRGLPLVTIRPDRPALVRVAPRTRLRAR
jgi:cytochrome P450